MSKKIKKIDPEKTLYAVAAIASFFVLWWFLTTFTPVKETTPGPIEVLQLLLTSFYTPIGSEVIVGHLLVSLRRVLVGFSVATIIGIVLGIAVAACSLRDFLRLTERKARESERKEKWH